MELDPAGMTPVINRIKRAQASWPGFCDCSRRAATARTS